MPIKQLSVFVQNVPGRLAEIAGIIAGSGIDIRALSLADTTNFGILRIIVDEPDKALQKLKDSELSVKCTNVIAVGIDDFPGGFAKAVKTLGDAGVSVEYSYAFLGRETGRAMVVFRTDNDEKALAALKNGGMTVLAEKDVYKV